MSYKEFMSGSLDAETRMYKTMDMCDQMVKSSMISSSKFEEMRKNLATTADTIKNLKLEKDSAERALNFAFAEKKKAVYQLIEVTAALEKINKKNKSYKDKIHYLEKRNHDLEKELRKHTVKKRELQMSDLKVQDVSWKQLDELRQGLRADYQTNENKQELRSYSWYLVEKMREIPWVYRMFRDRVRCSNRFFELIEKQAYCTAFLLVMQFLRDLLGWIETAFGKSQAFCADTPTNDYEYSPDKISISTTTQTPDSVSKNNFENLIKETSELITHLQSQGSRLSKLNEDISRSRADSILKQSTSEKTIKPLAISSLQKPAETPALSDRTINPKKISFTKESPAKESLANSSQKPKTSKKPLQHKFEEKIMPPIDKDDRWNSVSDFFSIGTRERSKTHY